MNNKKIFFIIILVISFLTIIFAIFNIIYWYFNSKNELQELKQISNQTNIQNNEYTHFFNNNDSCKNTNFIQIDFSKLKEINNSVVGWIKVEGTEIDYPFVHTTDNSFYLTHSFNKEYNRAGWVFLDYRNNINLEDKNSIIYAHAQNNKTMFGTLKNVLTNEWFANPNNHIIYTSTENQNSVWQIFSVYTIPTTTDYLKINFDDDFSNFTNKLINRSIFNFNNTINEHDKILTLSTCYNKTSKTVLHAKLIKTQYKKQ